ncbi:MAG: HEAT repeat domain-containing protein [Thermodesulfobacteriota bacterium]
MSRRKEVLVKSLQDTNERVRAVAAEALERLETRARVADLVKLIETGGKLEKLRGIYAVGSLRGKEITDLLIKAMTDEVEDVRAAAVRVLGTFADSSVLPHLIERLKDESPIVERVAIEALGNYRDPQLLGPLMQMLKSKDAGVVERAIDVVGRSGDKRAEEAMAYFAVKGNLDMRCLAIKSLGVMEG